MRSFKSSIRGKRSMVVDWMYWKCYLQYPLIFIPWKQTDWIEPFCQPSQLSTPSRSSSSPAQAKFTKTNSGDCSLTKDSDLIPHLSLPQQTSDHFKWSVQEIDVFSNWIYSIYKLKGSNRHEVCYWIFSIVYYAPNLLLV